MSADDPDALDELAGHEPRTYAGAPQPWVARAETQVRLSPRDPALAHALDVVLAATDRPPSSRSVQSPEPGHPRSRI